MKKFAMLVLALVLLALPMGALAATVNNQGDLQTAMSTGGTVTLGSDIVVDSPILLGGGSVTLNLNGHKIYNTTDIWNESAGEWSLISVFGSANLTINGSGSLEAKANDCYALDVRDGATVTINGGNFVGNISAIYNVKGTVTINGGSFSIQQRSEFNDGRYLLNCQDANFKNGTAKFIVKGGTYKNGFDPSSNLAEGKGTAFTPANATVVKDGNSFQVKMPAAVVESVSLPSTGDSENMLLWMGLMILSVLGLAVLGRTRRE